MSVKVLVVDDSSVMRHLVTDILEHSNKIKVVDTASNGKIALEKTIHYKPDVIVMDMIMGKYDGMYGVTNIMSKQPTPILLLTSLSNTDMNPILDALHAGAFDYVSKPSQHNTRLQDIEDELINKVLEAASTNTAKLGHKKVNVNTKYHTFSEDLLYDIVVIGSSTGGPSAIENVIMKFPGNLAIPVVIAQHMPENFVPSFVKRLNHLTPLEVVMGRKGMDVKAGTIIIAPGNRNMVLNSNGNGSVVVEFTKQRYKEFNFPSINALMESAANIYKNKTIGVVLTGMGKDGTKGITKIKELGGYTIAQDEETSVVFGMPKEAIKSGFIDRIIPIHEVGNFVVSCLS